jgi:elongation factor Ts
MKIDAASVKVLRETTGAGIMDCKRALADTKGNKEEAITLLREKGLAAARKRGSRVAAEGAVYSYIHAGGKVGVLVEVNCETDFVAKTEDFTTLVKDIAMHIAAANPLYVDRDEVPPEMVEKEKSIFAAQARESGKPEQIIEKMVNGKIEKFFKEICLMEQPFVKDPDITIEKLAIESAARIGEKLSIRRFARFKLGEGIEKVDSDLASEVASMQ